MAESLKWSWDVFISMISFVWNANVPVQALAQRLLLLLPVVAVSFSCVITILACLSVVIRQHRRRFISALLVTWLDMGRAIFNFWAGSLKFVITLVGWTLIFLRIVLLSLLLVVKDLIMMPLRVFSDLSHGYSNPGVPWPAVFMMMAWTLLEALIFTYVMTPLVTDVLSGLAGEELRGLTLQIPLYLMFVVFVLGSYAVLYTYGLAIKAKDWGKLSFMLLLNLLWPLSRLFFCIENLSTPLFPGLHSTQEMILNLVFSEL